MSEENQEQFLLELEEDIMYVDSEYKQQQQIEYLERKIIDKQNSRKKNKKKDIKNDGIIDDYLNQINNILKNEQLNNGNNKGKQTKKTNLKKQQSNSKSNKNNVQQEKNEHLVNAFSSILQTFIKNSSNLDDL